MPFRVRAGALTMFLASWLNVQSADAQTPGPGVFRVFHHGAAVGRVDTSVTRTIEGWHVSSQSQIDGDFQLSVRQFDAQYDASWAPVHLTMELATPAEHAVVHVAMMGTTTRTDIVRPRKEALFGANDVAADTIFLPDYVFGAFEALAARLEARPAVPTLPYFLVPRFELTATVHRQPSTTLDTSRGPLTVHRWHLTLPREAPAPVQVWTAAGRLVRVDFPAEDLSVVRVDIIGTPDPDDHARPR